MPGRYKDIIDCYSRGEKFRLHQMISMCANLHDFVYGIEISQNGKKKYKCCLPACTKDCFAISENLNWHQHRINKTILNNFLLKVKSLSYSGKFTSFDDFFEYIAKNSGLKNGHCLLVYDFCLRQGYHLSPKLEPGEYVYLFRGARKGAEHVLGKLHPSVYKLPTIIFQSVLGTSMSSMELEHFLCICEERLEYVGPIPRAPLLGICSRVIGSAGLKKYGLSLSI